MHPDWLHRFVAESNRIEGIHRDPSEAEVAAHAEFLSLPYIRISDLQALVGVCQPGNVLRYEPGMDVRVGSYVAPAGGPMIRTRLEEFLAFLPTCSPRASHVAYETLHPFTDGNGRSGRALWLWQHLHCRRGTPERAKQLGFLHTYYYETLAESRPSSRSRVEGE